nr:basic proline-rich protein-like [Odocoileus virginianus texanus]
MPLHESNQEEARGTRAGSSLWNLPPPPVHVGRRRINSVPPPPGRTRAGESEGRWVAMQGGTPGPDATGQALKRASAHRGLQPSGPRSWPGQRAAPYTQDPQTLDGAIASRQRPDADPAPQGLGRPPSGSQPGPGTPGPPRQDNESKGALGQSRGLEAAVGTPAQAAGLKATARQPARHPAPPAPPPGLAPCPSPARDPGVPRPFTLTPGGGNRASRECEPLPFAGQAHQSPRLPPDSQPEAAHEGSGRDVGWSPQGRRKTSGASAVCLDGWTRRRDHLLPAPTRAHRGRSRPRPHEHQGAKRDEGEGSEARGERRPGRAGRPARPLSRVPLNSDREAPSQHEAHASPGASPSAGGVHTPSAPKLHPLKRKPPGHPAMAPGALPHPLFPCGFLGAEGSWGHLLSPHSEQNARSALSVALTAYFRHMSASRKTPLSPEEGRAQAGGCRPVSPRGEQALHREQNPNPSDCRDDYLSIAFLNPAPSERAMSGPRTSEQERVPLGRALRAFSWGQGGPNPTRQAPTLHRGHSPRRAVCPAPLPPLGPTSRESYPAPRIQPKARSRDPRPHGHVNQADPTTAQRTSKAAALYPAHVSDQKQAGAEWVKELAHRPAAPEWGGPQKPDTTPNSGQVQSAGVEKLGEDRPPPKKDPSPPGEAREGAKASRVHASGSAGPPRTLGLPSPPHRRVKPKQAEIRTEADKQQGPSRPSESPSPPRLPRPDPEAGFPAPAWPSPPATAPTDPGDPQPPRDLGLQFPSPCRPMLIAGLEGPRALAGESECTGLGDGTGAKIRDSDKHRLRSEEGPGHAQLRQLRTTAERGSQRPTPSSPRPRLPEAPGGHGQPTREACGQGQPESLLRDLETSAPQDGPSPAPCSPFGTVPRLQVPGHPSPSAARLTEPWAPIALRGPAHPALGTHRPPKAPGGFQEKRPFSA